MKTCLACISIIVVMIIAVRTVTFSCYHRCIYTNIEAGSYDDAFSCSSQLSTMRGKLDIDLEMKMAHSPEFLEYLLQRWLKFQGEAFPDWAAIAIVLGTSEGTLSLPEVQRRLPELRDNARNRLAGRELESELKWIDTLDNIVTRELKLRTSEDRHPGGP